MTIKKQTGFTVIETMLFLSITGLMVVGMVAGTSISINTQRYNDSVRSLQSTIQDQYAELVSTENNRSTSIVCDTSADLIESADGSSVVGQSNCEVVGRYMLINKGSIDAYSVIAMRSDRQKPSDPSVDDISLMQNTGYMQFGIDDSFVDSSEIEWGAEIAWPVEGSISEVRTPSMPRAISLLFIRSPDSGQIYTFSSNNVPGDGDAPDGEIVREMIVPEGRSDVTLCVNSTGLLNINSRFIYIGAHASSSSSVEALTNEYNELVGKETRC